ncbi:MAG: hypothetical protein EOP84_23625 [Verrucomicrobiaceae bacterium]|nr:MAG: hypothetical protein EOP84_23625 [Verrucomicrobiaceae bacterium]
MNEKKAGEDLQIVEAQLRAAREMTTHLEAEVASVRARGRRDSPIRHPLAVLRAVLGMSQDQMAELAQCSRKTIQAVELGNLNMSDSLANRIVKETWVDPQWLTSGDPRKPIITQTGDPYTLELFKVAQAFKSAVKEESEKEAEEKRLLGSLSGLLMLVRDRGLAVEHARAMNDLWAINSRLAEAFEKQNDADMAEIDSESKSEL